MSASLLCPPSSRSLLLLVNRHRFAHCPAHALLFYMTQKIRGRALPLRPHSAGGTPTYIHACPPPRPHQLWYTLINLHTCLPCPRARLRCCTPRYTHVHACPTPAPALLRWRRTQIHIQIYRLSILTYIALTYIALAHRLALASRLRTHTSGAYMRSKVVWPLVPRVVPRGHFVLLAAQTPALRMPLILPRLRRESYVHARS